MSETNITGTRTCSNIAKRHTVNSPMKIPRNFIDDNVIQTAFSTNFPKIQRRVMIIPNDILMMGIRNIKSYYVL